MLAAVVTNGNGRVFPGKKCHRLYGTYNTSVPKRAKIARMTEKPLKKPAIKTAMRIPADLHADLQDAAARADHSMNTEIISRLTAALGGASIAAIMEQNNLIMAELKRTQDMVRTIIDAIGPRR
jgi:hypothetical protein